MDATRYTTSPASQTVQWPLRLIVFVFPEDQGSYQLKSALRKGSSLKP